MTHCRAGLLLIAVLGMLIAVGGCGGGPGRPELAARSGASLRGTVKGKATGLPVKQATVKLGRRLAATDAAGRYVLTGLAPGTGTLQVSAAGFRVFRDTVTLTAGPNRKNVTLGVSGKSPYFIPLNVGDRWVYASKGPGGSSTTTTLRVRSTTTRFGPRCFVLTATPGDQTLYLAQTESEALLYGREGADCLETFTPPLALLKLPLRSGASWRQSVSYKSCWVQWPVTISARVSGETLRVPLGEFAAFKVAHTANYPGLRPETTWWEPSIGPLRRQHTDAAGLYEDSLKDFTLY